MNKLTIGQHHFVLDKIATLARTIAELAHLQIEAPEDSDRVSSLATAVAAMAGQIGWAADLDGAMHRGSATDWMMPPSFHAAGKPPTTGGAQP